MGLNETPMADRVHIGFFGSRNAGKSSILNAITNQEMSIVADYKGTTTDPVYKSMEFLPLGPVVLIDTAGLDDEGEVGALRVMKTKKVLNKTDIAVLIIDGTVGKSEADREIEELFIKKGLKYIVAYNKSDIAKKADLMENEISVSAKTGEGIDALKEKIAFIAKEGGPSRTLLEGIVNKGDTVVLVCPIDSAAPKGRLILPQVQTIREILDLDARAVVIKENEIEKVIDSFKEAPSLVICDSQVFPLVDKAVREEIELTSFSILFARLKGDLLTVAKGAKALDNIKDGDKILICEGCTHHRQCDDIGTVKLPNLIRKYTGAHPEFMFTSGGGFPDDLKEFKMIIHCGACMLNEREVKYRMKCAMDAGIPFSNYGISIAYMNGILKRATKPFSEMKNIF